MVFLYHQAPKVTRWLVAFSKCRSTSLGSFTTNGSRITVSLGKLIRFFFLHFFNNIYRWYGIFHCSWTQIFGFGQLRTDHWPAREKVFKFLRQTAITNDTWVVCIRFLRKKKERFDKIKPLFFSEWNGKPTLVFCPTAFRGENTGDHSISISISTQWPNTDLFKDERSMPFYVDCLSHPKISSNTFDSKFICCFSVDFRWR